MSDAQADLVSEVQADRAKLLALEALRRDRLGWLRSLARLNVNEYRAIVDMLVAIRGWRIVAGVSDSKPKRSRGKRGKKHRGKR